MLMIVFVSSGMSHHLVRVQWSLHSCSLTSTVLVLALVEARAETFSTDNSCTDKKRWVGIDPVEVVHELDPVAGQELVGFAAWRH